MIKQSKVLVYKMQPITPHDTPTSGRDVLRAMDDAVLQLLRKASLFTVNGN